MNKDWRKLHDDDLHTHILPPILALDYELHCKGCSMNEGNKNTYNILIRNLQGSK
jgi:hypothetical protein